jgi:hypothetical protein
LSPRKENQSPPLTFEVREGMRVAIVANERIQNPSVMFEAREGVGVALWLGFKNPIQSWFSTNN